jgi:predicted transcriptional regulator
VIVRILTHGQYDVSDEALIELNEVDERIIEAVEAGNVEAFTAALGQLVEVVQARGAPLPLDSLVSSDLVLPAPGSTLEEVRALLGDEGLVPD